MSKIVSYLDCGCAIHENGQRTRCPTCCASAAPPDIDIFKLNAIIGKHARAAEERVADECQDISDAERITSAAMFHMLKEVIEIPNIKIEDIRRIESQTLVNMSDASWDPKAKYYMDGRWISAKEPLRSLRATLDWCERRLAASQG